jgi:hypothetical protein
MKVCLFDPGLENNQGSPSTNLGDLIIKEAVLRELNNLFEIVAIESISTHVLPEAPQLRSLRKAKYAFVGGTNLLTSTVNYHRPWKISLRQQFWLCKPVLVGVGWHSYQADPNRYSRLFLKTVLSKRYFHSVRDAYAKAKLNAAGINNVINTGCPTMWPLANLQAGQIPTRKADNALVMLTDYAKDPALDRQFLEAVSARYQKVFAWPQGRSDEPYLREISAGLEKPLQLLDHSFQDFQNFVSSDVDFDYLGTRLHGGVKCLLNRRRSLILEIDNRAKEIAKDTNLPACDRSDTARIIQWIENPEETKIKMNTAGIEQWRSQFKSQADYSRKKAKEEVKKELTLAK